MKYYIIAGEASGDLHGSNLMKALYKEDKNANIRFWGGDKMKSVGGTLVSHYKNRAFMGFAEVVTNISKIFKLMSFCKKDVSNFQPDVIIFIDNSGFNLRIAKWAKKEGFKTHYYISPQVWASRASRVKQIKRDIDKMFVILPFVKDFYEKYDYNVDFVGHPLIDEISNYKKIDKQQFIKENNLNDKKIVALLPGSRKQEISKMLPIMVSLIDDFKDYQFVIAQAPSLDTDFYNKLIKEKNVKLINNKTYDLLSVSHLALVTSGTATLETALFKVPQIVCYKTSSISYHIAKRIITLKFISLVNLIMDDEIVTELIQNNFNKETLKKEFLKLLDSKNRENLLLKYNELEQKLGGQGASEKTAKLIIKDLKND